ncbi:MAG TPA: phosphatase PAP2 family protein [Candidatus Sulfotelmatobacter sp.]|jgi:undecaprenyl-diphosphatase|nr:phosphatase PAP2 family protein [Candidatus Sulfotelmatobacter sp.]
MNTIIIICANYLYLLSIILSLFILWKTTKKVRISIITLSVLSLPLAFILAKVAGYFIYDPRPFVTEHIKPLIAHTADNGFPSDHTLLTMTIASIIFAYHKKLGITLFAISLLTGTARILAHVHHLFDIIGATAIAIVATTVIFLIKKTFLRKNN